MEFLNAAPLMMVTAVATLVGRGVYGAWQLRNDSKRLENDKFDRVESQKNNLTFELLEAARAEMGAARTEIDALRLEVSQLRPLEQHLFRFQQALDHIEALLNATDDDRLLVERNARAFLNRMRRLADAKGTIANEVQHADSVVELQARGILDDPQ